MSKVTVNITKSNIYSIAEGISVSISQHNGGVPSYEQLWASPDESRKLDIYYREAISDLERHLTEWLQQSSQQFDLTESSGDYVLTLTMSEHWPATMQGLLTNKIQDYLVHAVTAGWLNDFDDLNIKQDYQVIATQDVADIRGIIYLRAFNFDEKERAADGTAKDGSDGLAPAERAADGTAKDGPLLRPDAGLRRKDNVIRSNSERPPFPSEHRRHRDNDIVEHASDHTDWSGAGIVFHDHPACGRRMTPPHHIIQAGRGINQQSHRVVSGKGFTSSPLDRPMYNRHDNDCPLCPPIPPKPATVSVGSPTGWLHKDPRIPDFPSHPNYPPIKADGIGWSDEALYDEEGSEHFING